MKGKIIAALLALWLCGPAMAQGLRWSVCVVYPEYTEQEKKTMGDFALYLARAGYRTASRELSAYKSDELFGSGVLIEDQGRKLILTNRHVTGYAQTATVVFQLNDKNVRYPHCKVIGNSTVSDLSAIELPDECKQIPLPLATVVVEDGLDIFAAGFPGLGTKASWQLTRGTVSNAALRNEELGDRNRIQHTAAIDPGSSGGPLLVKVDGKYQIAGINTWKAIYREGVGIAIPVEEVATFLYELETADTSDQQVLAQLENERAEDWGRMYASLPDSTRSALHEQDWQLPFDIVRNAYHEQARIDSLKAAKRKHSSGKNTNSKAHGSKAKKSGVQVETDLHNPNAAGLYYDYLGGDCHEMVIFYEYQWWSILVTDIHIGTLLTKANVAGYDFYEPQPVWKQVGGLVFGGTLGVQLPIAINRYVLCPRLTESFTGGPVFGADRIQVALLLDTRAGLDFRFPVGNCELELGVHYTFNFTAATLKLNETAYRKAALGSMTQYLHHGFGVKLAVGF